MIFSKYLPSESIKEFVQFFWRFEGDYSDYISFEHSITASVYSKLAFQYRGRMSVCEDGNESTLFRSGFEFQTNSFYQVSAKQKMGVFGVFFHVQAIPLLFGISADVLTNCNIEISQLLGNEGKELEEKIILSKDTYERITVATNFIERKLKQPSIRDSAITSAIGQIISTRGRVQINKLSEAFCLSERQFERKFKEATGFSPKMFSRIVRFEECISTAALDKISFTDLTFMLGYYDQSHMIRDFKEFSGQNPRKYFSEDVSVFMER